MKRQLFKGLTVLALVSSFALVQAFDISGLKQGLTDAGVGLSKASIHALKDAAKDAWHQAKAQGVTKPEFMETLKEHANDSAVVQQVKEMSGAAWNALTPERKQQVKDTAKSLLSQTLGQIQNHLATPTATATAAAQ